MRKQPNTTSNTKEVETQEVEEIPQALHIPPYTTHLLTIQHKDNGLYSLTLLDTAGNVIEQSTDTGIYHTLARARQILGSIILQLHRNTV